MARGRNLEKPSDSTRIGWSGAGESGKKRQSAASGKPEFVRNARKGSVKKVGLNAELFPTVTIPTSDTSLNRETSS